MQDILLAPHAISSSSAEETVISVRKGRLIAIDIVRGYAMLAMLVIHSANDLSGVSYRSAFRWEDNFPARMASVQDWIGFILNFAPPAFFLLLGISLCFSVASRQKQQWTQGQITGYLFKRAVVIIAIEQFVLNWEFVPLKYHLYVGVLTTLGVCMCITALLRFLDTRSLIVLIVVLLVGVQAYYYYVGQPDHPSFIRTLLLATSGTERETIEVTFPILGWLPVVLMGFIFGRLVNEQKVDLSRAALQIGLVLLGLWLLIRGFGGFGNLYTGHPLAFTKSPPDLAYLLFYLAFSFLLLWFHSRYTQFESWPIYNVMQVFGQTALFFYILHSEFVLNIISRGVQILPAIPPLVASLVAAAISGVILFYLCLWYRDLRRKYPDSILKYI